MLTINGTDPNSLSFYLTDLTGWSEGAAYSRNTTPMANVVGVSPDMFVTAQGRQITIRGLLKCNDISERHAKLAALSDLFTGTVSLVFLDKPTIALRATKISMVTAERAEKMHVTLPDVYVTFMLIAYDPASYDIEPSIVAFTSTPSQIPVGTLPCPGDIFLTGAQSSGSSRVITYRSVNGIPYGSITLTPPTSPAESLGANDYLILSLARRQIIKVDSSGAWTSVYHWKTAGAWFSPQPSDCDRERGAYPTLETSTGEGVYIYRRAWDN